MVFLCFLVSFYLDSIVFFCTFILLLMIEIHTFRQIIMKNIFLVFTYCENWFKDEEEAVFYAKETQSEILYFKVSNDIFNTIDFKTTLDF